MERRCPVNAFDCTELNIPIESETGNGEENGIARLLACDLIAVDTVLRDPFPFAFIRVYQLLALTNSRHPPFTAPIGAGSIVRERQLMLLVGSGILQQEGGIFMAP